MVLKHYATIKDFVDKLINLLYVFLIFTYLSTEDKEAGADRALSVSLFIVVTGADVD